MSSKEDPNRNKNQHYVPESHFEEFSKDGASVCGLFKKNGIARPYISFGGQSSAAWFYGDAEREDEITVFDTKYFENRKRILKALTAGITCLPHAEVETLLENTQFQRERTLSFRKAEQRIHEFYEDFLHLKLRISRTTTPAIPRGYRSLQRRHGNLFQVIQRS
ncbi:hypothetical protein QZH47_07440 [Pseudomonas corrugata]